MKRERKLDQIISVIVLLLFVVIITVKWIVSYKCPDNEAAIKAINIIHTIILCLMFCVVLYNALGATGSIILKIVFIIITLFLIASAIACRIPVVEEFFMEHNIPLVI